MWVFVTMACVRAPRTPNCPSVPCAEVVVVDATELAACYGWSDAGGWPEGTPPEVAATCASTGTCEVTFGAQDWQTYWWCGCEDGDSGELIPSDCCAPTSVLGSYIDVPSRWLQAALQADCGIVVPVEVTCEPLPAEVPLGRECVR